MGEMKDMLLYLNWDSLAMPKSPLGGRSQEPTADAESERPREILFYRQINALTQNELDIRQDFHAKAGFPSPHVY